MKRFQVYEQAVLDGMSISFLIYDELKMREVGYVRVSQFEYSWDLKTELNVKHKIQDKVDNYLELEDIFEGRLEVCL